MQNRFKKFSIYGICIIFTLVTIFSAFFANNIEHTKHCEIANCSLCEVINNANVFIKNITLLNIYIILIVNINFIINLLKMIIKGVSNKTPIELKVVQIK